MPASEVHMFGIRKNQKMGIRQRSGVDKEVMLPGSLHSHARGRHPHTLKPENYLYIAAAERVSVFGRNRVHACGFKGSGTPLSVLRLARLRCVSLWTAGGRQQEQGYKEGEQMAETRLQVGCRTGTSFGHSPWGSLPRAVQSAAIRVYPAHLYDLMRPNLAIDVYHDQSQRHTGARRQDRPTASTMRSYRPRRPTGGW